MAKDLRSAIAQARDVWLDSDEGRRCCEGTATGTYLRNRIETAFVAGATIRESQIEAKIVEAQANLAAAVEALKVI
jgi:hypothetical protein